MMSELEVSETGSGSEVAQRERNLLGEMFGIPRTINMALAQSMFASTGVIVGSVALTAVEPLKPLLLSTIHVSMGTIFASLGSFVLLHTGLPQRALPLLSRLRRK